MLTELASLRLQDFEVFAEVARAQSVRETARRRQVPPGQISKVVKGLEKRLGTKLFQRSTTGVLLTSQGTELLNLVNEMLAQGERIETMLSGRQKANTQRVLTVASTAFLNTHFTAPSIVSLGIENCSFRFLDLPPDQLAPVGLRGAFELAIHYGKIDWPSTWISQLLGKSAWVTVCRADHPLPRNPTLLQILQYPFVTPTYWTAEGMVRGNDQFPIHVTKRKQGFETATADAAIPVVMASDQLAFLPEISTKPFIKARVLREVQCKELEIVEKKVFLSAKVDSVPNHIFKSIEKKMTSII